MNGLTTDRLVQMIHSEEVQQKIKNSNLITISIGGNNVLRLNRNVGVIDGIKVLNTEKGRFERFKRNCKYNSLY